MIVVRIEMWPGGDESKAKEFARCVITNQVVTTVQTGGNFGDYKVELYGGVWGRNDLTQKVWKRGQVQRFDRSLRGVWDLIYQALQPLVGSRNQ